MRDGEAIIQQLIEHSQAFANGDPLWKELESAARDLGIDPDESLDVIEEAYRRIERQLEIDTLGGRWKR